MSRHILAAHYGVANCDAPSLYVEYSSVRFSLSPRTALTKICLDSKKGRQFS